MRKIIAPLLFGFCFLAGSFVPTTDKRATVKTIVIDAGHGGTDPGCNGKVSTEAEVALAVALELGRILEENLPEVKVLYTRKDDHFVKLNDRAEFANKHNADLFVSIHCNSASSAAHGTETYTMGIHNETGKSKNLDEISKRENNVILLEDDYETTYEGYDVEKGFDVNSPVNQIILINYQNAFRQNSIKLATNIENQFRTRVGRNSRGVKQKGLWVLWKSYMPSVLVEVGFLTNANEEKFLNDKLNQTYMASGIFRAIRDYKDEIESMDDGEAPVNPEE